MSADLDRVVPDRRQRRFRSGLVLAGLMTLPAAMSIQALSTSPNYEIPRETIDAGAAHATSASFTLNGGIGQPDAGAVMGSASYTLRGGGGLSNRGRCITRRIVQRRFM